MPGTVDRSDLVDAPAAPQHSGRGPGRPHLGGRAIRSLSTRRRAAVLAVIIGFAVLPVAAAVTALANGWQPTGDVAIMGLRSRDTWTADPPLRGHPTTGNNLAGVESEHPGPIQYWLLGPAVRLGGPRAGLLLGTAVIAGSALGTALWLAFRRGGPVLLAMTAVALAVLCTTFGPGTITDPINSEVPTLPLFAAVLAVWSVLQRDWIALPAVAFFASLAAQPHVATSAMGVALLAIATVSVIRQARRGPPVSHHDTRVVVLATALAVLAWLPPLIAEVRGPSNIVALLRTSRVGPTLGLPFAVDRLFAAVAPIPLFARGRGAVAFGQTNSPLTIVLAAIVMGAAGSIGVAMIRRRTGPARLVAVIGCCAVVGILSTARAQPVALLRSDGMRWYWIVSALIWLALAWAAWNWRSFSWKAQARGAAVPVAIAVTVVALLVSILRSDPGQFRDGNRMEATHDLVTQVTDSLGSGRYVLRCEGPVNQFIVGPALALELESTGSHVYVDGGELERGYGPERSTAPDRVDGQLLIRAADPSIDDDARIVARVSMPNGLGTDPVETVVVVR